MNVIIWSKLNVIFNYWYLMHSSNLMDNWNELNDQYFQTIKYILNHNTKLYYFQLMNGLFILFLQIIQFNYLNL
jgi:hypothetical protein